MLKRTDPEPITIIAATAAVIGAGVSVLNYWKTHHGPLPHQVRAKLIRRLDQLSSELGYLNTDVEAIEAIFRDAQFPQGRTLRLGNGAMLTSYQFGRYQHLANQVFGRLRKIHRLALTVQGFAFDLPYLDKAVTTNTTGDALARASALLGSRDLSIEKAWAELKAIIADLERMIVELNSQLGR